MKHLKILPLFLLPPVELFIGLYFMLFACSFLFDLKVGDAEKFLDASKVGSLVIKDRSGVILRDTPSKVSGTRAKWVKPSEVSVYFINAVVAAEDRRFYSHGGIDPLAVARAALQNLRAGRIVSGGSTITQQVVKVATGGSNERTLKRKVWEAGGALFIERELSKERILESYLNWVTFGNLTRGVEAASRIYFDKPAAHLTLSEATALAALLRAPTVMSPYHHPGRLEERRAWILEKMLGLEMITGSELDYALANPPRYEPPSHPFFAPHLVDEVLAKAGHEKFAAGEIVTTIDKKLQDEVEHLADKMIEKVRHLDISNAAAVVMENHSGEILAYVGSSSYFDREREGMNDGVMAKRSPGSTLKPFIYAAAFERGDYPSQVIADIDTSFSTPIGMYKPRNYDGLYHGPVRMREALGSSYNIPAVKLVARQGPSSVLDVLRSAGFRSLDKSADYYGVALAVGDGEVTLYELSAAYCALARQGVWKKPTFLKSAADASGNALQLPAGGEMRVFSPQAAYLISDILSDPGARAPAFGRAEVFDFPFPVAVKTGTSNDYRDNWTVGYSSEITVGVWVGNFSGKPMGNISGITGAGPLFYQVMKAAMKGRVGRDFKVPGGIVAKNVCALSGRLAGHNCPHVYKEKFIEGKEPQETCTWHVSGNDGKLRERFPAELIPWAVAAGRYDADAYETAGDGHAVSAVGPPVITFPKEGSKYVIDPDVPEKYQRLKVRVSAGPGDGKIELYVDGKLHSRLTMPYIFYWTLKKGEHTLVARAKDMSSSPVTFLVY